MKNKSEEYVAKLCKKTFLSLWSYPNPRRNERTDKELCDLLVVCDPDIIVFSVKHKEYKDTGSIDTDWDRWYRKAIDDSVKQISGAERQLGKQTHACSENGQLVPLPDVASRKLHRVAVALGGGDKAQLKFGELDREFVHVFDDKSFDILIRELDTISDFVTYLSDKENLYTMTDTNTWFLGGEEDLLALYLGNCHKFPEGRNIIILEDDLWREFIKSPEYVSKKQADRVSYLWDELIESVTARHARCPNRDEVNSDDLERALRTMAREDRLARRSLSRGLIGLLEDTRVRSRYVKMEHGTQTPYVFLKKRKQESWDQCRTELHKRCFIVRGIYSDHHTVIGLLFDDRLLHEGFFFDLLHFRQSSWTPELEQARQERIRIDGYFKAPRETHGTEDEYPESRS